MTTLHEWNMLNDHYRMTLKMLRHASNARQSEPQIDSLFDCETFHEVYLHASEHRRRFRTRWFRQFNVGDDIYFSASSNVTAFISVSDVPYHCDPLYTGVRVHDVKQMTVLRRSFEHMKLKVRIERNDGDVETGWVDLWDESDLHRKGSYQLDGADPTALLIRKADSTEIKPASLYLH